MNHCEKHNQDYMPDRCPICMGEKMIDYTHADAPEIHEKAKKEYDKEKNGTV